MRWATAAGRRAGDDGSAARPTAREHLHEGTAQHRYIHTQTLTKTMHRGIVGTCANDPSAGSPMETLVRLLRPRSEQVHYTFRCNVQDLNIVAVRIIHRITQSVGATGGVYKGQGRNQHELMTRAY